MNECCDGVVLDWNPANDVQAMARIWREGQTKTVWIYRLLSTGSIEEKIYQRQLAKLGLSRSVMEDAATSDSRKFSMKELRSLFMVHRTTTGNFLSSVKIK